MDRALRRGLVQPLLECSELSLSSRRIGRRLHPTFECAQLRAHGFVADPLTLCLTLSFEYGS